MITAREAVELTKVSNTVVKEFLDKLDAKVREHATNGGRVLNLTKEFPFKFEPNIDARGMVILTPFQEKIRSEVKAIGFGFHDQCKNHYGQRRGGLGVILDENDNVVETPVTEYWFELQW
jgi:hypothetical protein